MGILNHRTSLKWLLVAGVAVVAIATLVLLQSARADEARQRLDSVPNCEVGSLMTIGQFQAPVPGTPEWEAQAFGSSREAAEDFASRYLAVGRRDGQPTAGSVLSDLGSARYYLSTPGSPDQGEVAFGVERANGKYLVLSVEFCSGAEPSVDIFSGQ